jgi:hypothetical protein
MRSAASLVEVSFSVRTRIVRLYGFHGYVRTFFQYVFLAVIWQTPSFRRFRDHTENRLFLFTQKTGAGCESGAASEPAAIRGRLRSRLRFGGGFGAGCDSGAASEPGASRGRLRSRLRFGGGFGAGCDSGAASEPGAIRGRLRSRVRVGGGFGAGCDSGAASEPAAIRGRLRSRGRESA